ncbi:MAG TPA: NepR family anti-sigma factor [Hyphomicrobium sp.]|nr:NepR family anti-sigma factor [Hyphomicrobium sp.]
MSEEKKAPWGKASGPALGDSRPGETMQSQVRQAAAAVDEGLTAATRTPKDPETRKHQSDDRTKPAAAADSNDAAKGVRARNQDVLPGILGKQLRAAYGELLNSPVPNRITDLIKQLEGKEAETPARVTREGEESN